MKTLAHILQMRGDNEQTCTRGEAILVHQRLAVCTGLRQRGRHLFFYSYPAALSQSSARNAGRAGTDWANLFRPSGLERIHGRLFVLCHVAGLKSRVGPFVPRSGTGKIGSRSPAVETAGYCEPSRVCGTVAMLCQRSLSPQLTGACRRHWRRDVAVPHLCFWGLRAFLGQDRSKSFFAPEK